MKSLTSTLANRKPAWRWRSKYIGYLYMLPSAVFLLGFLGFPIAYSLFISLRDFKLQALITGHSDFIGLTNYVAVLQSPGLWRALSHSLVFTVFSILFQFLIGLSLALLFKHGFPGSNFMRGLILTGWQIPAVVVGTLFLWMFNLDYGVVNYVLQLLGLTSEPIGWLIRADTAMIAVIVANVWLGIPFNFLLLSAGISGLPDDVYEGARVDGANPFQQFIFITLPLLRSTILAVLMLGFIYTLRGFDIIWIMTRGGPGDSTEVLPTFAYRLSFVNFNFGQSAAVSGIMLLMMLGAALLYVRTTREETIQ